MPKFLYFNFPRITMTQNNQYFFFRIMLPGDKVKIIRWKYKLLLYRIQPNNRYVVQDPQ